MKKALIGIVGGFILVVATEGAIAARDCAPDCRTYVQRVQHVEKIRHIKRIRRVRRHNVPEIDAGAGGVAIALLAGVVLLVAERVRRV